MKSRIIFISSSKRWIWKWKRYLRSSTILTIIITFTAYVLPSAVVHLLATVTWIIIILHQQIDDERYGFQLKRSITITVTPQYGMKQRIPLDRRWWYPADLKMAFGDFIVVSIVCYYCSSPIVDLDRVIVIVIQRIQYSWNCTYVRFQKSLIVSPINNFLLKI